MKRLPVLLMILAAMLGGCAMNKKPITTVSHVDLPRYMGDWYVIGSIGLFVEKDAYNAVEHYELDPDGTVPTTFTFNKGAFEGEKKTYKSRAFVRDKNSNAVWGVQFIWPFKSEYRIVYLKEDYSQVVVGRTKRDYVWIMARTPQIPDADYKHMLDIVAREGYDISKIRKVPQKH